MPASVDFFMSKLTGLGNNSMAFNSNNSTAGTMPTIISHPFNSSRLPIDHHNQLTRLANNPAPPLKPTSAGAFSFSAYLRANQQRAKQSVADDKMDAMLYTATTSSTASKPTAQNFGRQIAREEITRGGTRDEVIARIAERLM